MPIPFLLKYKPNNFDDIKLESNTKNLLLNLVSIDSISIILVGESGVGKTTIINAIINEYYKNVSKIDKNDNVLFVNSIKEQGINHYKNEINIFCQTTCTISNKKKTIIIDDLDNINEQNQQIYRNCLDKYQTNVNFVFACINYKKIINSILSRVLSINIKKISNEYLIQFAKEIIKKENIKIHDANIIKFVEFNSSIQNILNSLEKLYLLDKNCDDNVLENICSFIENSSFDKLTNLVIYNHDLDKGIDLILGIYNEGYSVIDILDSYFNYVKLSKDLDEEIKYNIIKLICKYITINNTIHDSDLELCFLVNNLVKIGYIYEEKSSNK
mgnify:FL=1